MSVSLQTNDDSGIGLLRKVNTVVDSNHFKAIEP